MSEILQNVAKKLSAWADYSETERGDGSVLPKGAGFPADDALKVMRMQRVLANTTYFRHYPNPTHNPIIEQLCTQLDAVGMSGNFFRTMNSLSDFSSGKTFLPRSKRNMGAHYAKPLVEIIEEQLEALLANTSFTQQQCDEADAIAAAMEDELLFYDQLREQANLQAKIGDNRFMLEAFRKLIPIWVAKQDYCKVWQPVLGNSNPGAKSVVLDARFEPNLFGSRFFDMERWWILPKSRWGEDAFAEEPIIKLISHIAQEDELVDDTLGERFKTRMAANLERYVTLVEAAAQSNGPFIPDCMVNGPHDGSTIEARDLFAELSVPDLYDQFSASLFPEAVKRKANLVFGAYLAPVVSIANLEELPFTFAGENGSDGGTIEATSCTPRSKDDGVALGIGAAPATITVGHKLTGVSFTANKAIEFPATERDATGSELLCIVSRQYDGSKWDTLRQALSNAARAYFNDGANSASYVEQLVGQRTSPLFNGEEHWTSLIKRLVHEECFSESSNTDLNLTRLRKGFDLAVKRFYENTEVKAAPDGGPSKTTLSKRLFRGGDSLVSILEAQELGRLRELAAHAGWNTGMTRLSQMQVKGKHERPNRDAMRLVRAVITGENSANANLDTLLNNRLLKQVRTCVTESISLAFGKTGKRLYMPVIMDFLTCGVLEWAMEKSEKKTLERLETCLSNAFNCFTKFERSITLKCWPDDTDAGTDGTGHLSAISSRHLAFFLDQNNKYRFSVTCLDAKNGAVVYAASQNGPQLCLSCRDEYHMNRLRGRASVFEERPEESFTPAYDKVIALSLGDTIDIPVYEGVTVQILG